MINDDTIKLLRECNAGVKMGVTSIDEVLDKTESKSLEEMLTQSKEQHSKLGDETREMLNQYHDEGKEPNPMAKGMSWMKTNVSMMMDPSDKTIADIMTDGCNMGVKSLSKYLNQYQAADEKSKDIAKRLITIENRLITDLRQYL